ncbi:hypothetical protein BH11BAC7_BH11BAC7_14190 [soil metagenome]
MQTRSNPSTEKESRSVAHTNGNNNSVKAKTYPVAYLSPPQQSIHPAQQSAQLFKTGIIAKQPHLISDNDAMAVGAAGSENFIAEESVAVAEPVLKSEGKFEEYIIYQINTSYESDCGAYADNLMRRIASFNRKTEVAGKETVNIEGGTIPSANPSSLFQETIASQPAPGIGQAYLVVNDPNDKEWGKSHFNFHWGVVVAKSGNDVITAETGSHTNTMKFDIYSQSKLSQSFQQRYMDAKKLQENAKTFQVNFTKTVKPTVTTNSNQVIEEL